MGRRTLTKDKNIRDIFFGDLKTAIAEPYEKSEDFDSDIWRIKPVNVLTFADKFMNEPFYEIQGKFCLALTGKKPTRWSMRYDEGHAFWGKGSGKDRTIAKLQAYIIYKLMCMRNPHYVLREIYDCSIADDDAIDTANMSINARQAKNVFFKKFKAVLKKTINPDTGKNWFSEQGVDLRDGYDIQETQVTFPHMITAHSLNSETNTGEGLNLFFSSVDEFGSFPTERAFELLEAIQDTTDSRFAGVGKIAVMSYMYKNNDAMDILYRQGKDNPRIYSSRAATYRVNDKMTKKKLSRKYLKNPEKARMTYECKGKSGTGGYITKAYLLNKVFDENLENPIAGDLVSIDYSKLMSLKFKDWFKGEPGQIYAVRFDLATGKKDKKNDCAGFSLCHPEKMIPQIDERLRKELAKEGIIIDMTDEELNIVRKGIIGDLNFQIVARPGDEIQLSTLRDFVIHRLKEELGFDIVFVSYDQWQSKDSIQIMQQNGIQAKEISVDRSNKPYDDWKELAYQQLYKTYPNKIARREAEELEINDKGKVDHPEKSWKRMQEEDTEKGSKDVMDAIVGCSSHAFDEIPVEVDVFFG